jgi:class 3 adenylate cyclase/CheY-like chemotaxis protein
MVQMTGNPTLNGNPEQGDGGTDPIRVLLIDDQPMIGEAIRRMLAQESAIAFHYCSDPTQALKAAKAYQPTVILQDLVMPDMDGLLLVKFLRSKNAITHDTPLIVLSSKEEPLMKAKAFELGANDYLVKLPDPMELVARVRYHSKAYMNLLKRQEAEQRLMEENLRQAQYIQQVNKVTAAAAAVEHNQFSPDLLGEVSEREDELGKLARVFIHMVQTVQSREQDLTAANEQLETLVKSYGRFVPHEYLTFLRKKSITDVQLGDHVSKTMAVMFSDIRSFTSLSESMTPKENFNFVNSYLSKVSPEIRNHHGLIVKFLGDGMMAVFPDGADDAVAGGVAKLKALHRYNEGRLRAGYRSIEVGIGIHVGHMMLGMVGEENRIQGDAFSDNVNLTARLEGLTKFYGVSLLISEQTLNQITNPAAYQLRFLDRAIVKGRNEPIAVYEVLDGELDPIRDLKLKTQADFDQGIVAYSDRNGMETAKARFERVLTVNPNDKTAMLYLDRVNQLLEQGVPENWNGVWTFTQK